MTKTVIKKFWDTSIRNKVMLLTIVACLVALFSVAGGIYVFQVRNFRKTFERELRALSRIMAENTAVALAFDDAKTAKEVLSPLGVKPEITDAGILNSEGKSFATFGTQRKLSPPATDAPAARLPRPRSTSWHSPVRPAPAAA